MIITNDESETNGTHSLEKSDVAEVSQPFGSGPPRTEPVADDRLAVTKAPTNARDMLAFLTILGIQSE